MASGAPVAARASATVPGMGARLEHVQARAMSRITGALYSAGYTPKTLAEAQRDTIWWLWARAQASANLRPLMRAWGIAWTSAGYAELVPIEVPRAGRGRVTVDVHTSAVSPGTERAQYLRLPNAQVGLLGRPGYSCAGIVRSAGPGGEDFKPGDQVAVTGAAHASLVTVPREAVYRVPAGVELDSAALVMLGIICGQGVRLARLEPGSPFCVVGAGLVGALALRLAAIEAVPQAAIGRSRRREPVARSGGARDFFTTEDDADAIAKIASPVVIDATGDPDAIHAATSAAAEGGRIVLLGSPRGVTDAFPVDVVRNKCLTIIGAHVDTLDIEAARTGVDTRRREGDSFLSALAKGSIDVSDLVGPAIDPREASLFYRRLARSDDLVGAHFDWTAMPPPMQTGRAHLLAPPNVTGRGMEAKWPIAPLQGRSAQSPLALKDPFSTAVGRLRLGLLGCGDIAVHNAAGAAVAPNVEVTACFDPNTSLAQDLAQRHSAVVAPSAEALVGRADVDAVLLAVPHHLHAPLAVLAAEAGKHVVVEKPPAHTLGSAVQMAQAAERAGVALSVSFPQRYEAAAMVAHQLVAAGAVGELTGSSIRLYLDKSPAYWLGGFSGRARSDWRGSKAQAGGGVLIMNASHYIDLLRHLVDVEVDTVSAQVGALDGDAEVEDAVAVTIRYRNGAVGSLLSSSAVRGSSESALEMWGRSGRLVLEPRPRVYSLGSVDGLRPSRWQTFGRLPLVDSRAVFLSRLASSLERGEQPEVSAADGLAAQAFIEAVYQSGETGEPVRPADLLAQAVSEAGHGVPVLSGSQ